MVIDELTARMVVDSATASPDALDYVARNYPGLQEQVARHPKTAPTTLGWLATDGAPQASVIANKRLATESGNQALNAEQPHGRYLRRLAAIAAIGLVVALTIWLVVPRLRGDSNPQIVIPSPPIAAPQGVRWQEVQLSNADMAKHLEIVDAGGDIALIRMVSSNDGGLKLDAWATVDVVTGARSYWTILTDSAQRYLVGDGVVVVQALGSLSVIDLQKGTTINAPSLGPGENLSEIAGTTLLTLEQGSTGTTVRARYIFRPVNVVWQASAVVPYVHTFAGGRFINTNHGVLDVATGQLASFGADSFADAGGMAFVYQGPDADHIVRMTCAQTVTNCALQRWLADSDSGVEPPIGNVLLACPQSTLVTVTRARAGTFFLKAYDWQSDQPLWTTEFPDPVCGQFVGNTYVLEALEGAGLYFVDAGSGKTLGHSHGVTNWAATDLVYVQCRLTVNVFDPNDAFSYLWSINMPATDAVIQSVGQRIVAVDFTHGRMWLLAQP